MTIPLTIVSMRDPAVAAAVKAGGKVECGTCKGHGGTEVWRDVRENGHLVQTWDDCPACQSRGHTVIHYVGRAMPRMGLKASPLGNPYKVGRANVFTNEDALKSYNHWLRSTGFPSMSSAIVAALDAIQPGDSLAHDGTELGAACAAVVARVWQERRGV